MVQNLRATFQCRGEEVLATIWNNGQNSDAIPSEVSVPLRGHFRSRESVYADFDEGRTDILLHNGGFRKNISPEKQVALPRSEERRVGKECRSRWSPYHYIK